MAGGWGRGQALLYILLYLTILFSFPQLFLFVIKQFLSQENICLLKKYNKMLSHLSNQVKYRQGFEDFHPETLVYSH